MIVKCLIMVARNSPKAENKKEAIRPPIGGRTQITKRCAMPGLSVQLRLLDHGIENLVS